MNFKAEPEHVKIQGRTIFRDGTRYLGYSGTSITFRFHGKKAQAKLWTDCEKFETNNYACVAVFINDETEPEQRLQLNQSEAWYTLYESDTEQDVTVTLMKYSEAEFAVCGIQELEIDTETLLAPPAARQMKMMVIGDSITCGYGIEDNTCCPIYYSTQQNPYHAYGMRTARALDADVMLLSWSGHGVISNYIGDEVNTPDEMYLIPEQYKYTDFSCSIQVFGESKDEWEKWDPAAYQPDLITVFLGTNDASYCRELPERNREFTDAYQAFISQIHQDYPKAKVLCMLGTMDQRLCPTTEAAVAEYQVQHHAQEWLRYLPLPMQLEEDGLGTNYHPTEITQKKLADIVIAAAKEFMNC